MIQRKLKEIRLMRVMYLTNIPSPYRMAFWEVLGTQCDLTVVFEDVNEKNRYWEVEPGKNFKSVFLNGFSFATEFHINYGLISHIKKFKYDVIVISGYNSPTDMRAINYLLKNDIPFIFSADGGFPKADESHFRKEIKHHFLAGAALNMSSGTMCDKYFKSYGVKEENIRRYNFSSITSADLEVPISIPARANTIKRKYGLKEKVVIGVGQFIPRKGFDILLDVWGHVNLKDTSLVLVGGGPDRKLYERIIRENDLQNVILIDFIPKAKLFELYRISDLFVFPTRYDIWGLTLGEAMACGLPVISSANAAATYDLVLDGENGYIESLESSVSWARRIEELVLDENKNKSFGRKSIEIMRSYTIEHMVDDYMAAFREINKARK
jgi:glycosyltransferase involved in cell wall biosynthesis